MAIECHGFKENLFIRAEYYHNFIIGLRMITTVLLYYKITVSRITVGRRHLLLAGQNPQEILPTIVLFV